MLLTSDICGQRWRLGKPEKEGDLFVREHDSIVIYRDSDPEAGVVAKVYSPDSNDSSKAKDYLSGDGIWRYEEIQEYGPRQAVRSIMPCGAQKQEERVVLMLYPDVLYSWEMAGYVFDMKYENATTESLIKGLFDHKFAENAEGARSGAPRHHGGRYHSGGGR